MHVKGDSVQAPKVCLAAKQKIGFEVGWKIVDVVGYNVESDLADQQYECPFQNNEQVSI